MQKDETQIEGSQVIHLTEETMKSDEEIYRSSQLCNTSTYSSVCVIKHINRKELQNVDCLFSRFCW